MKRPKSRSMGSALNPKANNVLPSGINAANPAPTQCIRPDTTNIKEAANTTQNALRQRNGCFSSVDSPLMVRHQYQTMKMRATSRMRRGMGVYNSSSKALVIDHNPRSIPTTIQLKNSNSSYLVFNTSLSFSAISKILVSVVSQSIQASVTDTP